MLTLILGLLLAIYPACAAPVPAPSLQAGRVLPLSISGHDDAQGLAGVQQVEGLVDLCQLELVGDVLSHPELALHVAVHQLGNIHA